MKDTQEGGKKSAEINKEHQDEKNQERTGEKGGAAKNHQQSPETTRGRGRGKDDEEDDDSPASRPRESVGYTRSDEHEGNLPLEASERQGNTRSQGKGRSSQGDQSQGGSHSKNSGRSQNDGHSQNDGRSQNGNRGSRGDK